MPNHLTKILVLCASALCLFGLLLESARMKPAASAFFHGECNKACGLFDYIMAFVYMLMFCHLFFELYTLSQRKRLGVFA